MIEFISSVGIIKTGKYIISFALIIFALSCSKPQEYSNACSNSSHLNLKPVFNKGEKFSVEIPYSMKILPNPSFFKFIGIDTTTLKEEKITYSVSIEHYKLNENQSFEDFYRDIDKRTKERQLKSQVVFYKKLVEATISGRPSRISTLGIKDGNTKLMTRQFYIQEMERIFVLTLGTNSSNYEEVFCRYYPIVKSIKGL